MDPLEALLRAAEAMQAACEQVAAETLHLPEASVYGIPRELFDRIPARQHVRGESDNPSWVKWYKGVEFFCWDAPEVVLQ